MEQRRAGSGAWRLWCAALCVVSLGACDCASAPQDGPTSLRAQPAALSDPAGCAAGVESLAESVHRGVCYAHNWQDAGGRGYGTETSRRSLGELRALGAQWVSLTPFAFMSAIDAPQVRLMGDTSGGETDRVVERQITQAREAGMHVLLKPHIWIRGGAWRGHIDMGGPAAWRLWFASYRHFVLHYARMAQRHGVEVLAVGVELDSIAVRFEDAWRRLLQEVREVYEGRLVYCANWDSVADVGLWDAVDYIGVQFYPSLADAPGAADTILARRLARHMDVLEKLYQRTGRPILFTEVGYRSIRGAEVRPHAWPEREAREISHAAQARAWRLFFAGLAGRRWVRGVYLWKWFTDPATDEEGPGGFSPRGKPAEAVVRAAYGGCR